MRRNAALAVISLVAMGVLAARPASATAIAIPDDTFTLTGSFTGEVSSPFAAGAFTLSVSAPASSFASGYPLGSVYQISAPAAGTYTAGGVVQTFTSPSIDVISTSPDTIQIAGFIGGVGTAATFTINASTPLFTATEMDGGASSEYQFITGSPTIISASATDIADPPISNPGLTVTGTQNPVPEPASLILLGGPLAALGLLRRRSRRAEKTG